MSGIDVMSDNTGKTIAEQLKLQNAYLGIIAKGSGSANITSMADVKKIVQSGLAKEAFNIGDQIVVPWRDSADTEYSFVWDVVHFEDVTLADGEVVPGMYLCAHYATKEAIQFSHQQAFYYAKDGLAAGTYNITIGTTWGTNCVAGKTYQFTLTQDVPAGGKLSGMYGAPDTAPTAWKCYSWKADAITQIETVGMTEGAEGTNIGTITSGTRTDMLNGLQSVAYGLNDWEQSAYRQYINSESDKNAWWKPQNNFDIMPDQLPSYRGFLKGFDDDFKESVGITKIHTFKNTLLDGGVKSITNDKIFLPSLEQYFVNPQIAGEGVLWEYFKRRLQKESPVAQYSTNPELVKYAIESHSSAQSVRLRSAFRGSSYNAWLVNSSGNVSSYYASYAVRCAPACIIC